MSIIGTIFEDVTTNVLGPIGSWQWLVALVSASLMIPAIFHQYEDMVLLKPTKYVMCIPGEITHLGNTSLCSYTIVGNVTEEYKCNKWYSKLLWMIWLKKSWLIFCGDDEKLKQLSTTMICRLGVVFGCVIYGLIADSLGRRKAIVIDVFSQLLFNTIITFCDSESWFRLLVFLMTLFQSAHYYMGILLICEIASNSWRTWLIIMVATPRLFAFIGMLPLANSVPNSDTYSLIAALFGGFLIGIIRWCPESPQWLLFNRKIPQAENILFKAAQKNNVKLCEDFKIRPVNHRAYNCLEQSRTCIGTLNIHNIRLVILTSLIFWGLYQFLWSSLYLRAYSNGQRYMILKILACTAAVGVSEYFLAMKLSLKQLILINTILTGTLTSGVTFLGDTKSTSYDIVSTMALASGIILHALLLNLTPRLFAINIRGTLFGSCHATGQIGSIISYIMFTLEAMDDKYFAVVEIVVTLALIALCLIFPDVDERELPDVVEDMDYFVELSKPLRWATQKTDSTSQEEVQLRVYSFGSGRGTVLYSDEYPPARPNGIRILCHALRHIRQIFTSMFNIKRINVYSFVLFQVKLPLK